MVMKSLSKKLFYILIFGPILMWILLIWYWRTADFQEILPDQQTVETEQNNQSDISEENINIENLIYHDVPFTAQAPFEDWDDIRQQNACEEASMLMAMLYIKNETISAQKALDEILKIDTFEETTYGYHLDTSAQDTAKTIRDYFNYPNIEYKANINIQDIKLQLVKGNLVIVPADGQKLRNPYYTQPGPETHMLLIIGYDPARREFITNDPGTKRGKNYKYDEEVLYNAIRDYPTGYHVPITSINKVMITVEIK